MYTPIGKRLKHAHEPAQARKMFGWMGGSARAQRLGPKLARHSPEIERIHTLRDELAFGLRFGMVHYRGPARLRICGLLRNERPSGSRRYDNE